MQRPPQSFATLLIRALGPIRQLQLVNLSRVSSLSTSSVCYTNRFSLDYHSFFYNLLSVRPFSHSPGAKLTCSVGESRATSISFLLTVAFIFAARYLPVLRWSFKVLYIALGSKLLSMHGVGN
jgi:hypothetical protein